MQLQAEKKAMQKQLEIIEKEIELYRGDVRTKISEIDEEQSRCSFKSFIVFSETFGDSYTISQYGVC